MNKLEHLRIDSIESTFINDGQLIQMVTRLENLSILYIKSNRITLTGIAMMLPFAPQLRRAKFILSYLDDTDGPNPTDVSAIQEDFDAIAASGIVRVRLYAYAEQFNVSSSEYIYLNIQMTRAFYFNHKNYPKLPQFFHLSPFLSQLPPLTRNADWLQLFLTERSPEQ